MVYRQDGSSDGAVAMCDRPARLKVFWDFDWSLVNENTDTWVVKQLAPELEEAFKHRQMGWTDIMAQQMIGLHEKGHTEGGIAQCLRELPVDPNMVETVKLLRSAGVEQIIISDSNTFFIDTILQHHGIRDAFSRINTNGGVFTEAGVLCVTPHHPPTSTGMPPHECPLCPPNLCKGSVFDSQREGAVKVIYIGDGGGDFCATTKLNFSDLVLARHDENLSYGLWKKIQAANNPDEGNTDACKCTAEVKLWGDGMDVLNAVKEVLANTDLK